MPVPQITPPGLLDQHGLIVALTPAAIVGVGAVAAALLDWSASKSRQNITRWCVAINGVLAIILLALFLKPAGPAAAYTEPLAGGLVRVGYIPNGMALLLALWAAWRWNPWKSPDGQAHSSWAWSARVGFAMLLPIVSLPILAIPLIYDQGPSNQLAEPPRRWLPVVILCMTTCLALMVHLSGIPHGYTWVSAGAGLVIAGLLTTGPWRLIILAAGLAMCIAL